jgi:hypothetical protein
MNDYPKQFTTGAINRVEREKINADRDCDKQISLIPGRWPDHWPAVRDRSLRVFRRFSSEAVRASRAAGWSVQELDRVCMDFLKVTLADGRHRFGSDGSVRPLISHIDGSILPDIQRELRATPQWTEYENLLTSASEEIGLQRRDGDKSASKRSQRTEREQSRAIERQAFLAAILKKKRWTRSRLAERSAVGKATIQGWWDGTRATISEDNRKAIADTLEIDVKSLPE